MGWGVQCKATAKRTGERCQRPAIIGARVCHVHGGRSPNVQKSARERLAELVNPALDGLRAALDSGDTRSVVQAARAILDRAGYPAASRLEIEQAEQSVMQSQAQQIADVVRGTLADLGVTVDSERVRDALQSNLLRVGEGRPYRAALSAHVDARAQDATEDVHDAEVVE